MNGQSNQPDETIKVPENRVEDTDVVSAGGVAEVIRNDTQAGRDRIAALLADTVDNGTNEVTLG